MNLNFWTRTVGVIAIATVALSGLPACTGNKSSKNSDSSFLFNLGGEPTTLNPITGTDLYNQRIQRYVFDSLMERNPDTYEWEPSLAEKVELSPDGKIFTFTIRKDAKFHDGKPVTAEDLKFSFDAIFDPKYKAAHLIPYFENFEKAEVVDPHTIRYTAKTKYFGNLDVIVDHPVLPKHYYGDGQDGSAKNKEVLGSGPFKLEKYDQAQGIVLAKNKEWMGFKLERNKNRYQYDRIRLRFDKDENIAIEKLKKGDLDFDGLTPEAYTAKTDGPEWGKRVHKAKVENLAPKSYGYIGWNFKRDLFKDRDVRLALYHLMNRDEMNKKFRYGMSLPATGPWYQQSDYADPNVKAVEYDPKKALELFKKAGWEDTDKNGILDKVVNGKKQEFRFNLIYSNKDTEKYFVFYQEDLKKAGVDMQLQLLEWNSLIKNLDEQNFDAAALAWGGGSVDLDPKQIWHSSSATAGGSNFISYKNPEVDKMIDEARNELDKTKRIPLLRKVYAKIAEDVPYAFLFNDRYILYAHSDRMKMDQPTRKYEVGYGYWRVEMK